MGVNMSPIRDPERTEAKHLLAAAEFNGKKVLEIGCGKADLTWQYAKIAQMVCGIDPVLPDLRKAKTNQPASISTVLISQAVGEALPFPSGVFDIAVFSSSL
jgi:ubiquinone/menaquinone biosynthesis C-methylase UbiE